MAQSDSSLSRYITRVHSQPKLAREREQQLARRWLKKHDTAARDEIIATHLRYVVAISLKYRRYGVPVADLIAEGNFGLVHALSKFDPERGLRFVTYAAYWIRAYVLNHVIRSWSLVGVGSGVLRSKTFFKLRRERIRLLNVLGDEGAVRASLAVSMGVGEERMAEMLRRLDSRDASLDARVFEDSPTALVDTLVSPAASQEDDLGNTEARDLAKAAVRAALDDLDRRERFIVEQRLMADPEDELSLAEIGRRLGVSRERARQLEVRAKRKLRSRITEIASNEGGWLETAA